MHGYVENGEVKESVLPPALNPSVTNLCIKIPDENWNFIKLVVGADKIVNAYVNGRHIRTFEAHFTTRGFGGVLAENGFNNIAEFRNFDIAPIMPNTYGKYVTKISYILLSSNMHL